MSTSSYRLRTSSGSRRKSARYSCRSSTRRSAIRRASRRSNVAALYSLKSRPMASRTMTKILLSAPESSLRGDIRMAAQTSELLRQRRKRQRIIDDAGVDRAVGHAAELRRLGILREGDAVLRLDGLEPFGPVAGGAREDDADRVAPTIGGQRAEEEIDGQVRLARFVDARKERQDAVQDPDVGVGRNDIDVIGLDALAILGLAHRHCRRFGQRLGEQAWVRGIEVLNEHEGHSRVARQLGEQ